MHLAKVDKDDDRSRGLRAYGPIILTACLGLALSTVVLVMGQNRANDESREEFDAAANNLVRVLEQQIERQLELLGLMRGLFEGQP